MFGVDIRAIRDENLRRVIEEPHAIRDERQKVGGKDTIKHKVLGANTNITGEEKRKTDQSAARMKICLVVTIPSDCEDEVTDNAEGVDSGDGVNWSNALHDSENKDKKYCHKVENQKLRLAAGKAGGMEELRKAKTVDAWDFPVCPNQDSVGEERKEQGEN